MPISFDTDFWLIATQALGAIGTIASVLFAYTRTVRPKTTLRY